MGGSTSTMITAAIGGVIAIVIALVVYPILQSAADTYYLEYHAHCEINNEPFLRVYPAGVETGDVLWSLGTVTESSGACSLPATPATQPAGETVPSNYPTGTGQELRSEHGIKVGSFTSAVSSGRLTVSALALDSGGQWVTVPEVLAQYQGISTLILSILPILAVTGFLGISAANIYQYTQGGSMGIQQVVVQSIAALIITIVGIYLAPTIMDFLNDVYLVSSGSRYGIMGQFNTIITLVLGFVPVVYNAGLLGMFAYQGVGAYKKIKGGMGSM